MSKTICIVGEKHFRILNQLSCASTTCLGLPSARMLLFSTGACFLAARLRDRGLPASAQTSHVPLAESSDGSSSSLRLPVGHSMIVSMSGRQSLLRVQHLPYPLIAGTYPLLRKTHLCIILSRTFGVHSGQSSMFGHVVWRDVILRGQLTVRPNYRMRKNIYRIT